MAISGSSALKINTEARITHLQGLTATLLSIYLASVLVAIVFGLPQERLALRLKWCVKTRWSLPTNKANRMLPHKGQTIAVTAGFALTS